MAEEKKLYKLLGVIDLVHVVWNSSIKNGKLNFNELLDRSLSYVKVVVWG